MSNQSRHPAGTSVGGQFAPGSASEVEAELVEQIPRFAGSDEQRIAANSERRAHARMVRNVIEVFRRDNPQAQQIVFTRGGDGRPEFEEVRNADGSIGYQVPFLADSHPEPVLDIEDSADFDTLRAEYIKEGPLEDDFVFINCDKPPAVPPKLIDSPPSSPMHEATGGRLWSPVLDDRGTGYRRDQIVVGDETVEIEGNEMQAAEIGFYEAQGRQMGDFS